MLVYQRVPQKNQWNKWNKTCLEKKNITWTGFILVLMNQIFAENHNHPFSMVLHVFSYMKSMAHMVVFRPTLQLSTMGVFPIFAPVTRSCRAEVIHRHLCPHAPGTGRPIGLGHAVRLGHLLELFRDHQRWETTRWACLKIGYPVQSMVYHHFLITIAIKLVGHSMISPFSDRPSFISCHITWTSCHIMSYPILPPIWDPWND